MSVVIAIEDAGPCRKKLTLEIPAPAVEASGEAIATLIEQSLAAGRVKGFKPHPAAFLGYLVSHEAHHRGQAVLTLGLDGRPVDRKVLYGLWEWGVR